MSSKLVKLPKPTRSTPYTIQTPYEVEDVKGHLTVLVLANNTVQCYGAVEPQGLAMQMLNLGMQRIEQYYQQKGNGSGLVGLDGLPLASAPTEEGAS